LFAKRDIKKGELVIEIENKERTIVSRNFANNNFKELDKEWFDNYAYPISDDLFVTWSDDPDKHIPINHSCDPNIWYEHGNENLYARHDIKKGDQLTIDYATYVANISLQFECKCGEACCRNVVTSNDYMKQELIDKYKGHFSCYLTSKMSNI
jgi:SET domain-containing protein